MSAERSRSAVFLNVPAKALVQQQGKEGILVATDEAAGSPPFHFVPMEVTRKGGGGHSEVLVTYSLLDAPSGVPIDVANVALKPRNATQANEEWRRTQKAGGAPRAPSSLVTRASGRGVRQWLSARWGGARAVEAAPAPAPASAATTPTRADSEGAAAAPVPALTPGELMRLSHAVGAPAASASEEEEKDAKKRPERRSLVTAALKQVEEKRKPKDVRLTEDQLVAALLRFGRYLVFFTSFLVVAFSTRAPTDYWANHGMQAALDWDANKDVYCRCCVAVSGSGSAFSLNATAAAAAAAAAAVAYSVGDDFCDDHGSTTTTTAATTATTATTATPATTKTTAATATTSHPLTPSCTRPLVHAVALRDAPLLLRVRHPREVLGRRPERSALLQLAARPIC